MSRLAPSFTQMKRECQGLSSNEGFRALLSPFHRRKSTLKESLINRVCGCQGKEDIFKIRLFDG
ncbi:MAG: hypothetical protein ACO3VB_03585, partial [Opitutales bacterium]